MGDKYKDEFVADEMSRYFLKEFHGKRFGYVVEKSLAPLRQKIAHAFTERKGFDLENLETLSSRLEVERDLSTNRMMAREIVRTMMHNEYWK